MRGAIAAIVLTLASQQPRDAGPPAVQAQGAAVIRGRVVAPGTKTPVPGAIVTLGGTAAFRSPPQTVYSDANGRFEFKQLRRGTYGLSARPAHYQMQYLDGPRIEVPVLADDQIVEGIELTLTRAGAIVGRLVDEFGQPIGGLGVYANRIGDRPGVLNGAWQSTDEYGRYRLFHMAPGGYVIVVRPSGSTDYGVPGASGFLETYYPGTPSRSDAVRVDVRAGEETEAGDLRILRGRMLRVRGMVVDSQGRPAQSNRTMVSLSGVAMGSMSRNVDAQGRFDFFQPEPPGVYRLSAIMRSESGQSLEEYVAETVALVDADVDVTLATKPAVTVKGRIVIDDQAQPPPGAMSVRAQSGARGLASLLLDAAPVTKDLTFTFPRLAGEQLLRMQGLTGNFALQAVMRGNEDVTDIPTEFKTDDAVRILLGPRTSGIQGTVTTDAGKPVPNYAVLLFSEDKRTWVQWSTRVLTDMRTNRDGHYVGRASPGRYYVIAVPLAQSMQTNEIDPAVLESLVRDATTVVIAPDEMRVVDLKVGGQ